MGLSCSSICDEGKGGGRFLFSFFPPHNWPCLEPQQPYNVYSIFLIFYLRKLRLRCMSNKLEEKSLKTRTI